MFNLNGHEVIDIIIGLVLGKVRDISGISVNVDYRFSHLANFTQSLIEERTLLATGTGIAQEDNGTVVIAFVDSVNVLTQPIHIHGVTRIPFVLVVNSSTHKV
jgi:hypothetical protein